MSFGADTGSEEQDYNAIPVLERLSHKVWKARQSAYEELSKQFENSPSEDADCFKDFLRDPQLLKSIAIDSNAVAQEAGILAISNFVQYGGRRAAIKSRELVVTAISEKAISAARPNTKQRSTDALLWYVEMDKAEPVLEFLVPSLSAKLPKLVAANVKAMNDIYKSFGCKACSPKIALDVLPKLFGHADRTVRAESIQLSVTLRSYIGKTFDSIILENLKPAQQKELNKEFEKIDGIPTPTRLLRSEQIRLKQEEEAAAAAAAAASTINNLDDVEMQDAHDDISGFHDNSAINEEMDPYNLVDPIDVLAKLPSDFDERINSAKWKDRVEVLEETLKEFKVIKMKEGDYFDFVKVLVKCLKDANIYVVTLACNLIDCMGSGLRADGFGRFVVYLLNPLLERTKEKKVSVTDALGSALDTCFRYSSFNAILEPTLEYMVHKTPQVKIECTKFLIRCLKTTEDVPSKQNRDSIINTCAKLLSDPQAPVRTGACEVLGTLMKIIGERAFKLYIEKVDSRHLKKVEEFFKEAVVVAKPSVAGIPPTKKSATLQSRPSLPSSAGSNMKRLSAGLPGSSSLSSSTSLRSQTTIPSKRGATSPLKGSTLSTKMNLTSRSLKPLGSIPPLFPNAQQHQQPQQPQQSHQSHLSNEEREELETLRSEKAAWLREKESLETSSKHQTSQNEKYSGDISSLNLKIEEYQHQFTALNLNIKSKETQLYRLQGDLESSRSAIRSLEQRLHQSQQLNQSILGKSKTSNTGSPVKNEFDGQSTIPLSDNMGMNTSFEEKSTELNRRISGLSIHSSAEKENNIFGIPLTTTATTTGTTTNSTPSTNSSSKFTSSLYDFDNNDDSWKKAAEVTNQLKARIEQMKARTRTLNPV